jgi:hypothetical protein
VDEGIGRDVFFLFPRLLSTTVWPMLSEIVTTMSLYLTKDSVASFLVVADGKVTSRDISPVLKQIIIIRKMVQETVNCLVVSKA